MVHLLGWTPEDLVGRSAIHLWHPDDREAAVALNDQVYAGETGRGVFRLRAKDGRYAWIEASLRPFVDEHSTLSAVWSMRDVTARIESNQARAESEERFRLTMQDDVAVSRGLIADLAAGRSPRFICGSAA